MQKMKKFLILALSFVASLGLFVACGEKNSSQSSSENAPTSSVVSSNDVSSSDESTSSNDGNSSDESTSSTDGSSSDESTSSDDVSSSDESTSSTDASSSDESTSSTDVSSTDESTSSNEVSSSDESTSNSEVSSSDESTSSTDGGSSDESTSSTDGSSSDESTPSNDASSSEDSSVCEEHAGGEADCIHKAVCESCGTEYGEVDEENHAFTVETATWTTGEGEHAGFDVKACVCGFVYDAFDVTNETVTDVDLGTEHIRVMALLDEKYQEETFTAELVDLRYKGESVAERRVETADELLIPVSIFGGETGRQYISFIFTTADGAEHEVKAYVVVIAETPANEAQEIVLTGESYAIRLGRAYEGATVASITSGDYHFGTDPSALDVPAELKADKQAHGERVLTVTGTLEGDAFVLDVPVVFITAEIGDVETFQNTITTPAYTGAVYGYYTLTANIGTGNDYCVKGEDTEIAGWASNHALGFQGTLDGKNYSLHTMGNTKWGLFGVLRNATVKNLTITDGWYSGRNDSAIFGHGMFNSVIENVTIRQVGGTVTNGTGWLANGRVDTCTFKNVTVESSATITQQISLFGNGFYAGEHANACTFENFVIKGFTIQYLGTNEDGNGRTIYVMEGQTIEGAKDVKEVLGIRYATEEA